MPQGTTQAGIGTLAALVLFIIASVWISVLANRVMRQGSFMKGFFLGNRGLGSWALALTATVQSGGTFMGFPSLVYTHGWAVALWISGYMVVPITGFGILGKRLAQLSRRTGAITVPDLFRARFGSPMLGLVASLLILFYMSAMMIAQFKAGALVMKLAWPGSGVLALTEDTALFRLSEQSLTGLVQSGRLPQPTADKLGGIAGQGYDSKADFERAVGEVLAPAERESHAAALSGAAQLLDWKYVAGLGIFTVTVVGYTLLGGFLAAVWTDLFQSVMMLIGVMLLLALALSAVGSLEQATLTAVQHTDANFAFAPGYAPQRDQHEFLPLGLAFSFFGVWVFAGLGSPAGMVRIMASDSTDTIRRSIYLLAFYNLLIYLPLVLICICGRALIPDLPPGRTDEIIPQLALRTTADLPGGSFVAGLILAAPFGAIMATVSSYLVVIASGLVRDVYQRFLRPDANSTELKRLSYMVMIGVGGLGIVANIWPVDYLQSIVVFSGTGSAATFCVAALMAAFWRRATVPGVFACMLAGAGTMLGLYAVGFMVSNKAPAVFEWLAMLGLNPNNTIGQVTKFRPYYLLGCDPMVWGLLNSLVAGVLVSLATRPPDEALLSKLFDAPPSPRPVAKSAS